MAKKYTIDSLSFVNTDKCIKQPGFVFINMMSKFGKTYSYKRRMYKLANGTYNVMIGEKIYNIGKMEEQQGHTFEYIRDCKAGENFDDFATTENEVSEAEEKIEAIENFMEEIGLKTETEKAFEYDENAEVFHEKFNSILACVANNIPVYLAGPAGSGKNFTLEQIAKNLGLDFYFTNSVQQEYKLTGFIDAGGAYHDTEFYRAFTNGGLFFLDEIDASIPEVLVLLNAAIANGYFEFPVGKVNAHENFRVVAAGNTVGNGADEQYTGRMVIDQATLDRFAVIDFGYSKEIELHIAKGNAELVNFIEELRENAEAQGIRATFSYRCIAMVTKLEANLNLVEVLTIAVVKGLDKDTIRTLSVKSENKYSKALREIQKAA